MIDQARIRTLLARLRIVLYVGLFGLAAYFMWRYETVSLPDEGCSPLRAYAPGDRLIVDLCPSGLGLGDAVLFRSPAGELLLGRIADPPGDDAAPDVLDPGTFWIVKDDTGCPGDSSTTLGAIPETLIEGRIATAVSW